MQRLWQTIPVLLAAALFASFALVALPTPAARAQACPELVTNGGFETTGGWQFGTSPVPPQIVTSTAHSGTHSLRLGITTGANTESFSSARQTVTIPTGVTPATLSFWVYTIAEPSAGNDYMELAFLSPDGSVILAKPWQSTSNDQGWTQLAYDLSAWQGQTFQLYFNVYNDGTGGRTGMYLDDVSLTACPSTGTVTVTPTLIAPPPTATPTLTVPTSTPTATSTPLPPPTWTPTATPVVLTATPTATFMPPPPVLPTTMPPQPVPAGCTEFTQNGGFEAGFAGWVPGASPLPPAIVTAPVLSGAYAAQLGSQVQNVNSYSSIRQTVSVPPGSEPTFVSFWTYTWAETATGADRQEFALLGPGDAVWAIPWRVFENAQAWQQHIFQLVGVAGQTFDIYFAAINDGAGGRVALYLDEVHLWSCSSVAYPATTGQMQVAPEGQVTVAPDSQMQVPPEAQALPTPAVYATPQVLPTLAAQAVPYPVETPSTVRMEQLLGAVAPAPGTVPPPQWTEVAIGTAAVVGQPVATLAAEASTLATLVPQLQTPAGAVAQLGTVAPAVAATPTPQPAGISGFLSNITSRWPPNWPFILLGIIGAVTVVVLIIRWLSTTTSRWPFILLGMLAALIIIFLIVRSRLSP